ncbi:hypothetical protein Dsin_030413 [Dipteronia sinensis]|uniref:Uncharacterized protein n=1 Tax=Dipteronia sinensis TaxID=43782 RepID=A0AAD9ZJK9_9ROSI|nr:hypothetical protein Dsin_030413 [Dipteronia sinensis]
MRRLQGAFLVMRFDRSLNSFFVRVVALAEVLGGVFEVPGDCDGTRLHAVEAVGQFCCRGDGKAEIGDAGDAVIANRRSLRMERLVRMKTMRGISFFPGIILLVARLYLWLSRETGAEKRTRGVRRGRQ